MNRFNKRLVFFLILFSLGFIIYSNTLTSPFVFDDHGAVESPRVMNLKSFLDLSGTRYLADVSFALNYAVAGFNPLGYHLVNILIHIMNAIFVYLVISLTFKTPLMKAAPEMIGEKIAMAASLIFLTHPVETEAVTYIAQRYSSLATFFYLLSIIFYLKARSSFEKEPGEIREWVFYAGCIIFTAAAQKTKEISFTLPVMIAFFEFTFFDNSRGLFRRVLYMAPVLLSLAIIPKILYFTKGASAVNFNRHEIADKLGMLLREDFSTLPRYDYLITQFRVIITYLRLLVSPVSQNVDYDYPVFHTILAPPVFLSFIFLLSLFSSAAYLYLRSRRNKNPWGLIVSFGVLWFFITISVESSIIPIADIIFEHRLYLPGIGIMISFSTLIFYFLNIKKGLNEAAPVIIAVIVIVNSFATFERNTVWATELTLWEDVVKKSPNKARGYSNVGFALGKMGKTGEAADYFEKAVRLKPDLWLTNYNMANALLQSGRAMESLPFFYKTIKLKPDYVDAYNGLGFALVDLKKPDEALKYLGEAVRLRPEAADSYNNLGNALLLLGRIDEAIANYEKALTLAPGEASAKANLANALKYKGNGRFNQPR